MYLYYKQDRASKMIKKNYIFDPDNYFKKVHSKNVNIYIVYSTIKKVNKGPVYTVAKKVDTVPI